MLNESTTISKHHVLTMHVCLRIYVLEVPITMLVLQMEAENEHATSSTSLKLEEATIDQVLLSQKNSYSQHTWSLDSACTIDVKANNKIFLPFTAGSLSTLRNSCGLRMVSHHQWIIYPRKRRPRVQAKLWDKKPTVEHHRYASSLSAMVYSLYQHFDRLLPLLCRLFSTDSTHICNICICFLAIYLVNLR